MGRHRRRGDRTPVDGDTLFVVFSATKGVLATAIHLLAERGAVDYEAPVARYWPAFGAHGKERVTVRQVLAHQAGIPQLPPGTTPEQMCDWDAMCAAVADLAPLWEPGSRTVYHGLTFGWILGEVLRRVDGRDVRAFVHQEIAGPRVCFEVCRTVSGEAASTTASYRGGYGQPTD